MPVPGLIPAPIRRELAIAYTASVDNVDLWADIGSPTYPVDVYVQVASGVVIGAALKPGADNPDPAFFIRSSFASGSRVYIANFGRIAGGGGIGGMGARGRDDGNSPSSFVGGGGGGGAGSSSQGGPHAVEADPDAAAMTDGDAGTDELGGAGGDNDFNGGIGNSPYVARTPPQNGGAAILCNNVDLFIDNALGEIWAGAAGGSGGFQNGSLPGGANDPADGDDLAADVTSVTVAGDEPAAVYHSNTSGASGYTLTWISGDEYPEVRGYVREIA
jgi:hypothetical protein